MLLTDRNEIGWKGIPERETKHLGIVGAAEFVPEHVHHNYKHSDAYEKSKANRTAIAASMGELGKTYSNPKSW